MIKGAVLLVAAAASAGCGSSSNAFRTASPIVLRLGWHTSSGGLSVTVRALTVRADGWSVAARIDNGTAQTLQIGRIHRPYPETTFGIAEVVGDEHALPPQRYATRFDPPLPRTLSPGASWSGVFSGTTALPAGHRFRVVFGTFFVQPPLLLAGRRYSRFNVYSDQSALLR